MDFKINKETVSSAETVYSGIQEHGVELDYILPDYYPDVFRLIRCEVCPVVTERSVSGDKLSYELCCDIRLIYSGENGAPLQCISQRQNFSKTIELSSSPQSPEIKLTAKTDHVNFRAVNKRRLDVRGAVSVQIAVTGEKPREVVSDAFGMNIQLKKIPVRYAAKKLSAEKQIQLCETMELTSAQPDIIGIIRTGCTVGDCEKKLISGKILVKGEAAVTMLYSCESGIESAEISLPFSQIVDIEGVDDTFICTVEADVMGCAVTPLPDKNGENRSVRLEPELRIRCRAVKPTELMAVTDAYSTVYPCDMSRELIPAEQVPAVYRESFRHTAKLCRGDDVPKKIFAMWCSPKNINTHVGGDGKSVVISGMLTYSMAAEDESGAVIMPDHDEAFEETFELGDDLSGQTVTAEPGNITVSYNISAEGELTAKADATVRLYAAGSSGIRGITELTVDDTVKKSRDGDYAIKLYFCGENEDIWDIAKRFATEVDAIAEENELTENKTEKGSMLLIPIK